MHTFKRTHPLKGGKVHPNGTVYLGDGYWGIENGLTAKNQKPLLRLPHPLIAIGGLRYHTWRMDVGRIGCEGRVGGVGGVGRVGGVRTAMVNVSAIAGVACPELEGETCLGVFDNTEVKAVGSAPSATHCL